MKETAEAEELDERDEEDEDEVVPVESESYVNLRKKMVNKHNLKIDNLLQENNKLCREFQRKQVKKKVQVTVDLTEHPLPHDCIFDLSLFFSHPGALSPCWSRGGDYRLGKKKKKSSTC